MLAVHMYTGLGVRDDAYGHDGCVLEFWSGVQAQVRNRRVYHLLRAAVGDKGIRDQEEIA